MAHAPQSGPLAAARLTGQLLSGDPARSPEAVAERVLAIQAQDPVGARLAVRARSRGLTAGDVDRALTVERSLVVDWLNRGTLHLVRAEDRHWLHALSTPPLLTANLRRLAQEGVAPAAAERGVAVVVRALTEQGALRRRELRGHLDSAGVPTRGQALVHILFRASLLGHILRGPLVDGEQAFVLVRDWLGEAPAVDRDRALAELARRYLAGHHPSSDRDLATWAGLPLRDAHAGLAAIANLLTERTDGLLELTRAKPPVARHPPRLLGPFDPVLHGWRDRRWLLGDRTGVVTSNGIFRPIAIVNGRAVATWSRLRGRLTLEPFGSMTPEDRRELEQDADRVAGYLG